MMEKFRIKTDIGSNQKITVELQQSFDLLEILSLKLTQKDIYTSLCSDYGVVVGRITVNNGFGVPNAKISIFVPLSEEDEDDPVISELYPYKSPSDLNEDGFRYNLLPARKQHGGHEATGTFPDQLDILTRDEILEVYEKYYKYTVKTNDAGDFMIWGVPIGQQILHVDLDLSDIGCFSLRPYDFIINGASVGQFKNNYEFDASENLNSLPQIKTFDKTIEVYPFWGNPELCDISITRTDFDLSEYGLKIEPNAYLIGGTYTDSDKMSINKNCTPKKKMGKKCELITKSGIVEGIRFTSQYDEDGKPLLEYIENLGTIDDEGSFMILLPMNMEYIYTNEFGENEYTNNPNIGIPTSSCYRLRLSLNDSGLSRTRTIGSYLVPNIREYNDEESKSYSFSLDFQDYPEDSIDLILNSSDGFFQPKDYFYRVTYNKVYTVSSFNGSHFKGNTMEKDRFLGIKDAVPGDDDDCGGDAVTPPVNFGVKNYTFQLLIADMLLFVEHVFNLVILLVFNTLANFLHSIANIFDQWPTRFLEEPFRKGAYSLQSSGQKKLYLITYPECDECRDDEDLNYNEAAGLINDDNYCLFATATILGNSSSNDVEITNITQDNVVCTGITIYTGVTAEDELKQELITNGSSYFILYNGVPLYISDDKYFYEDSGTFYFLDRDRVFNENITYNNVPIYSLTVFSGDTEGTIIEMESGCDIYDVPYNEEVIEFYYGPNREIIPLSGYTAGMEVSGTNLSNRNGNRKLVEKYKNETYSLITESGQSEFSNGIFYVVPGTQTNGRLLGIILEYYRRKRIGTLFCGGIVNFSYIDNWLSGSLYFFQFKSKIKDKKKETKVKYCKKLLHYSEIDERFYYRSTLFNPLLDPLTGFTGYPDTTGIIRLGRPTTLVDLGPRDEFIKEICLDKSLDPNCSVSRSIGSTSFQDFGELLGLAINYRLDVADKQFNINKFFDNDGFNSYGMKRAFDGDILQLISIHNETGIEEFDLQSLNYAGYSFQFLDPDAPPTNQIFNGGPIAITFYLSGDGQRIRACINQPGNLTESSQLVPFYLWDKKGTGFGPTSGSGMDDQSWDYKYSGITVQPLQGMYNVGGTTITDNNKYLLLPMTYTYSGFTYTGFTFDSDLSLDFNVISETPFSETLYESAYPGFTYLEVTGGTEDNPTSGILYTKVDTGITITSWDTTQWNIGTFIIRKTQDYYTSNRQILSTPFTFYFGLRPGKTGLDRFIENFGPKDFFNPIE